MFVRWFFLVGGVAFLMAALWVRERPGEGNDAIALTFALMGFFWAGPQLVLMAGRRRRS